MRTTAQKAHERTVRWAHASVEIIVEPLHTRAHLWFSKQEMEEFRAKWGMSGMLTRMGSDNHDIPSCSWGLEHIYSDELARDRFNRRQEAWDVVIDEQDYQQERGQSVPGLLAELYQDITRVSQLEAQERAQRYRKELLEI